MTDILIEQLLTPSELIHLEKRPLEKASQWLLGRYAAKTALTAFYANQKISLSYHDIEIENLPSGAPHAHILIPTDNQTSATRVSISHCNDRAIAAVCVSEKNEGLGVDIEKIRTFAPDTIVNFLDSTEYQTFEKTSSTEKKYVATLYWSLKEALLKALGTGLRLHPKKVSIHLDLTQKSADFIIDGNTIAATGIWQLDEEYIITQVELHKPATVTNI